LYLFVLAALNFSRRPVIISGARDTALLGIGVLGLIVVGPMELFLPRLPSEISGYVWVGMLLMYGLALTLGVLMSAPRIVAYNVSLDQLRPVLSEVVNEADPDARWAGGSVAMPRLQIEFYLDENPSLRNVSLVAAASRQSFTGWRLLEKALKAELRGRVESAPNLCGVVCLAAALIMVADVAWIYYRHGDVISQGFSEMLRF